MIATARALRKRHGDVLKIVFIGPCVAKKGEAASDAVRGDVDAVITFIELRELFRLGHVDSNEVKTSAFDPPHAGPGALFSITRGMLQAAKIDEDLMRGDVVAADGRRGDRRQQDRGREARHCHQLVRAELAQYDRRPRRDRDRPE